MNLPGKRVFVTGAGGFIGSHLAEQLVTLGCKVVALTHYDARVGASNLDFLANDVRDEIEIVAGDIRDPFFVERAVKGMDVVFHLAALIGIPYSYAAVSSYVDTNVVGTLNVLQACVAAGVSRVVHTSTSECYGTARYTPIDEGHPLRSQSPYAATKTAADKLAEAYFLSFNLPVVTIRPFNTFGPRQSARAIVPTILSQLLGGCQTLSLGSLDPVRDLTYVRDTAAGFIAVASSDTAVGEVLNIGVGEGLTIRQIAETAMDVVGRRVPLTVQQERVRPDASEVRALICDSAKAALLTGWRPIVSFQQGLTETANFVAAHPDLYRPEEYSV